VTTDLGGSDGITALVLQPDGRLIALARYHTIDADAAIAIDVYLTVRARTPDAKEVAYWVDVLMTALTPDTVRGMLHVVFDGTEFRHRPGNPWQYVAALYQAMLAREPDRAELD
jgi:hypothetical protein